MEGGKIKMRKWFLEIYEKADRNYRLGKYRLHIAFYGGIGYGGWQFWFSTLKDKKYKMLFTFRIFNWAFIDD